MSVFRVSGSPYFQFDFQYKSYRFYGSTKCRNERDAKETEKAKRAEAKRIVDETLTSGRKPLKVGEAFDRWWKEVGERGNDPDIKRALQWLKQQIGPEANLHDLTDDHISRAVEARRSHVTPAGKDTDGNQRYRPVSARTINKTVTSLASRVVNRARKNWNATIFREPVWSNHKLKEQKRPVREITAEEEARLDQVESPDYAELREFAIIMGLRRKELLLTWPQVDFKNAVVRIIGKGGKPATLPLTERAVEILRGLRGNHKTFVWTFIAERTRRCPKTGVEFVKGKRYPMSYHGLSTNRRRKWPKAGVDARLHDTRHTTGMRTLRSTGNLKLVQEVLRHSEVSTTARFYVSPTLDDIRAGMEATAASSKSQKKSQSDVAKPKKMLADKRK